MIKSLRNIQLIIRRGILIISIFILLGVLLVGCSTTKGTVKNIENSEQHKKSENQVAVRSQNETNNGSGQIKENVKPVESNKKPTASVQSESEKTDELKPEGNVEEKIIGKGYKQKETISILDTIEQLEQCYETQNFKKWKSLLTPAYKEKYSDPAFLKQQGWNDDNLESFFYLLIQTREKNGIKSLPISKVEFVSPNKAYVYVLFKGKEFPKPQHTFIKIGNSWYKGLPDEGE